MQILGILLICVCVCVCVCVCWSDMFFYKFMNIRTFNYVYIILIFMNSCIVDDSVEIPTRCSFVIEFIIPKFIEGSARFERHTAHHQEL